MADGKTAKLTFGDSLVKTVFLARRLRPLWREQKMVGILLPPSIPGALVNWAALVAGVVDKVFLYYAPKILAGTGSVPFAGGQGFRRIGEAAHVKNITLHRFGEDFAVEGYIKNPYS